MLNAYFYESSQLRHIIGTNMLENIELQKNILSMESLIMIRPHSGVLGKLGNYFEDAKNAIGDIFTSIGNAVTCVEINEPSAIRTVMQMDYVKMANIRVHGIATVGTDYLSASKVLLDCVKVIDNINIDSLEPFKRWLTETLNDPRKMENLTQYIKTDRNRLRGIREAYVAMTKGGTSTDVPYRNIVKRNSDWQPIVTNLNVLAKYNLNGKLATLHKTTTEIEQSVDSLIRLMNAPNMDYRPSSKFVSELVEQVYAIAEELEFYASVVSTLNLLVNTARDNLIYISKK